MRKPHLVVPVFWVVVVAVTLSSMALPASMSNSAPSADVCAILSRDTVNSATDVCNKAGANSVCLAQDGVNVTLNDNSASVLKARGDEVDLSKVVMVTTSVTDPASGKAGVALLKFPGGQSVTGVLFGDAKLTFSMTTSSQATADAPQNANTATNQPSSAKTATFVLDTSATANVSCDGLSSGLLVQSASDTIAHLIVNGADIAFGAATLFMRATPQDRLEVAAIEGKATVSVAQRSVIVASGNWTRIRVGGADGLTANTSPPSPSPYSFAALDGSPLGFLPNSVACTVGLSAKNTAKVSVRVGPGEERGPLFFMAENQNFRVKGQGKDSAGKLWWQLQSDSAQEAWVAQADVHSAGKCDDIAQATPPPVRVVGPQQPTDNNQGTGSTSEPISRGFVPTGRTIWDATVGPLTTSGICNKIPPAYCNQLVQLTPSGTGLLWKGQELQPYYMTRIRENVYSYSGPNPLGDARLRLTLEFTSPTGFRATQVMTPTDDPQCKDSFTFSGTFLR